MLFISMKFTITDIIERQRARFYKYKQQNKLKNVFKYKKQENLQKARQFPVCFIYKNLDTLRYAIFREIFEYGIYMQQT